MARISPPDTASITDPAQGELCVQSFVYIQLMLQLDRLYRTYWSQWTAAICALPYHLLYLEDKICWFSLCQGLFAQIRLAIHRKPGHKGQICWRNTKRCAENQWKPNASHPRNRCCSPNYIFWKRSVRAEFCFLLLTQWESCPRPLSEQGHTLKLIHQSLDKFCGNRESSDNDWSWCWRRLVQRYVAGHVPKKLLGTVQEQQLAPGPSSQGDGGDVTGAPGCLGERRSQSRQLEPQQVSREAEQSLTKGRIWATPPIKPPGLNDVLLKNSKWKWSKRPSLLALH